MKLTTAFPDLKVTVHDQVAEGPTVVTGSGGVSVAAHWAAAAYLSGHYRAVLAHSSGLLGVNPMPVRIAMRCSRSSMRPESPMTPGRRSTIVRAVTVCGATRQRTPAVQGVRSPWGRARLVTSRRISRDTWMRMSEFRDLPAAARLAGLLRAS